MADPKELFSFDGGGGGTLADVERSELGEVAKAFVPTSSATTNNSTLIKIAFIQNDRARESFPLQWRRK
jgi:hypothetical protein